MLEIEKQCSFFTEIAPEMTMASLFKKLLLGSIPALNTSGIQNLLA
jgi:hypothetical protein